MPMNETIWFPPYSYSYFYFLFFILFIFSFFIFRFLFFFFFFNLPYFIFWIRTETPHSLLCDRREACKESSDETESLAIIFSAEINLLWRLNRVWVSSSYVRTQDVTLKTCRRRWMTGRGGERWLGISVLAARHDDDDIYIYIYICFIVARITWLSVSRRYKRHRVS